MWFAIKILIDKIFKTFLKLKNIKISLLPKICKGFH